MKIQQKLQASYHEDPQLRDRLMNGVILTRIKDAHTDRHPINSHQLVERVANKLSHKTGTAGASVALLTKRDEVENQASAQALYGLR